MTTARLKRLKRTYVEARHRSRYGVPSPGWRRNTTVESEVKVWMDAFDLAKIENVSPWDALLLAVGRRAARVRFCDAVIQELIEQHHKTCEAILSDEPTADVNADVPPAEARVWMAESRNEERLMTRAAKMAVDAGVADAQIRRIEMEARFSTDAMIAALDALELAPDQRLRALAVMHQQLTTLPAAPPPLHQVVDMDIGDDDPPGAAASGG